MPQKTKKQKLAAEKRKNHISQHSPHIVIEHEKSFVIDTQSKHISSTLLLNASTSTFKRELYKSLIISAAIIVVEIVIYLAQNKVISITNLF